MVDIIIKLNEENYDETDELNPWRPALVSAALEIQQLNQILPEAQVSGPIPCNPEAEYIEGFLGDVNTLPNEYGYVTARIANWRKLVIPIGVTPTSFAFVYGTPVEDKQVVDENGNPITDEECNPIYEQVYGGTIQ